MAGPGGLIAAFLAKKRSSSNAGTGYIFRLPFDSVWAILAFVCGYV